MTAIFWFRNDLRLSDNPGLTEAAKATDDLIPIFILDEINVRPIGAAQRWWLHHSLNALKMALQKKGVRLILKKGDPKKIFSQLIKQHKVTAVYWNHCYEPALIKRDQTIKTTLNAHKIKTHTFNASLLTEPEDIKNKSGGYFKVFTPYWKHVSTLITPKKTLQIPRKLTQKTKIKSDKLEQWQLLPKHPNWSKAFKVWKPGEIGAQTRFKNFIKKDLSDYIENRDRPDLSVTSRLSPHLHFGEISIWQVWNKLDQLETSHRVLRKNINAYLRQLIWREFAHYLLWHFPSLPKRNFREKFNRFKWKKSKKHLQAWQKGLTGYPIVDAGMRELWATGYMHNRVRMIVASFLIKDLLIDWREGEKWFWDTLVDADLANNALGWQWVAGSGPDASPFFRIFNPTLQGKKFDPDGAYIKKWVPELRKVPAQYIHHPFDAPASIKTNYPKPIVDHKVAHQAAMKTYKGVRP